MGHLRTKVCLVLLMSWILRGCERIIAVKKSSVGQVLAAWLTTEFGSN